MITPCRRLWPSLAAIASLALPLRAASFPEKPEDATRIAVLGCHRQFAPAPALDRYPETNPDYALWVGDNVYIDTQSDLSLFHRCYDALAAREGYQWLKANVPFAVTWDDHDYGDNNDGIDYPLKADAMRIFREFWEVEDVIPAGQPGIYHTRTWETGGHTLQVILLDVRYNREDPAPDADMLGEAQWEWLAGELAKPADLRLLVSGTQILVPKESGSETWDQYPRSRARLYDMIRRAGVERVLFVTGDQHYSEVARARGVLDFDLVELQFAGINQIERLEFNPYRVTPPTRSRHSLCFMDIQWEPNREDVPHVTFQVFDAETTQAEYRYRVNFSELELPLKLRGDREFVEGEAFAIEAPVPGLEVRYTTGGGAPSATSPLYTGPVILDDTTTVRAAYFHPDGWRRGQIREATYTRVEPISPVTAPENLMDGLRYRYTQGEYKVLPDFESETILASGIANDFDVEALAQREDHYAIVYEGYLLAPATGMYRFLTRSDDGSKLYLHGREVVDNDGSHSARIREGILALEAGLHPLRIEYFEDYMGQTLGVFWVTPGNEEAERIPFTNFRTERTDK